MNYKLGLSVLSVSLPVHAREEYLVVESRLMENVDREELYGSTETIRAERAQIVNALNRIALAHLGASFNDLCNSGLVPNDSIPLNVNSEVIEQIHESTDRIIDEITRNHDADYKVTAQMLSALQQHHVDQSEVALAVFELREWAQSVQQSGMPFDQELRSKLDTLVQHNTSGYQYLQFALPIVPGLLSYNVELGSQHQRDLTSIWERIKSRFVKGKDAEDSLPTPPTPLDDSRSN